MRMIFSHLNNTKIINGDLKHIYDLTKKNSLLVKPTKIQNIVFGTPYQLRITIYRGN